MYKQLKGFFDSFLYKLVFSHRLSGCLVPGSADMDEGWSVVTLTQVHGFDSRFYWNGSQKKDIQNGIVYSVKCPLSEPNGDKWGEYDYIRFANWVYAFQRIRESDTTRPAWEE